MSQRMTLMPAVVRWFSLWPFALERDELLPDSEDPAGRQSRRVRK